MAGHQHCCSQVSVNDLVQAQTLAWLLWWDPASAARVCLVGSPLCLCQRAGKMCSSMCLMGLLQESPDQRALLGLLLYTWCWC
jgi:hypothetical protein